MTFSWWQTILVGLIVFWLGFGVRHLTYNCPEPVFSSKPGIPDTVFVQVEPVEGRSAATVRADRSLDLVNSEKSVKDSSAIGTNSFPSTFSLTTDSTMSDSSKVSFTSKTTVYNSDSAYVEHYYTYEPAPRPEITIPDSVFVPVPVPAEVPFIEKPIVVAGITATIVYIIIEFARSKE